MGDLEVTRLTYCTPKRTNWDSYREDLKVNLGVVPRVIHSVRDVELAVDLLQQAILLSYRQNCPARVALSPRTFPWWNKELSRLKASTRRLFNHAKRTGDWESYKMALTCYNKDIRKAKRSSWRDYCQGIEDVPDRARLMRIKASRSANRVESIKLLDGQYTQSGKETLRELYRVHFPGSAGEEVTLEGQGQPNLRAFAAHREDWELSKRAVDQSKISWVISTFKPFKSAGTDGIVPALLQQGVEQSTTHLCRIFRSCLARGVYTQSLEAGQGDVYP
jgi:hypothetical protein